MIDSICLVVRSSVTKEYEQKARASIPIPDGDTLRFMDEGGLVYDVKIGQFMRHTDLTKIKALFFETETLFQKFMNFSSFYVWRV